MKTEKHPQKKKQQQQYINNMKMAYSKLILIFCLFF